MLQTSTDCSIEKFELEPINKVQSYHHQRTSRDLSMKSIFQESEVRKRKKGERKQNPRELRVKGTKREGRGRRI